MHTQWHSDVMHVSHVKNIAREKHEDSLAQATFAAQASSAFYRCGDHVQNMLIWWIQRRQSNSF
jgi:hypothetical protein